MSILVVGCDLAQQQDFTAIAVVEATPSRIERTITDELLGLPRDRIVGFDGPPAAMALRWLERVRGIPYPQVVAHVTGLMRNLPEPGTLVLDKTGVGAPVFDLFVVAGLDPIGITITAGRTVGGEGRDLTVPKVDLVSTLIVGMQGGRLKIAPSLDLAPTLARELENFKLKINPQTMHESFASWREAEHDDLVLAAALAVWTAEQAIGSQAWAAEQQLAADQFDRQVAVTISPV